MEAQENIAQSQEPNKPQLVEEPPAKPNDPFACPVLLFGRDFQFAEKFVELIPLHKTERQTVIAAAEAIGMSRNQGLALYRNNPGIRTYIKWKVGIEAYENAKCRAAARALTVDLVDSELKVALCAPMVEGLAAAKVKALELAYRRLLVVLGAPEDAKSKAQESQRGLFLAFSNTTLVQQAKIEGKDPLALLPGETIEGEIPKKVDITKELYFEVSDKVVDLP